MTTVAVTKETTGRTTRNARKKHSVAWLERELAEAREDLRLAGERLDATNISLTQKNDALTQALNERDAVRNERDEYYRALRLANVEWAELRKDLQRLRDAHEDLSERYDELYDLNQRNFDKAVRNGDVAAVLASCIVAEMDEGPAKTLNRFAKVAMQMGVSNEVLDEVKTAFSRGSAARAKQVVDDAVAMATEPDPPQNSAIAKISCLDFLTKFCTGKH